MAIFRHFKSDYLNISNDEIKSEEYSHEEQKVNGELHIIGTKKTINLCDNEWAKRHFPDPNDYTLKNLIESGAGLNEVSSNMEATDDNVFKQALEINNIINKNDKKED